MDIQVCVSVFECGLGWGGVGLKRTVCDKRKQVRVGKFFIAYNTSSIHHNWNIHTHTHWRHQNKTTFTQTRQKTWIVVMVGGGGREPFRKGVGGARVGEHTKSVDEVGWCFEEMIREGWSNVNRWKTACLRREATTELMHKQTQKKHLWNTKDAACCSSLVSPKWSVFWRLRPSVKARKRASWAWLTIRQNKTARPMNIKSKPRMIRP
jgi:hypothetical protein